MRVPSFLTSLARRYMESVVAKRPPDFLIGGTEDPYMRRWWIIPRNKVFNVYMHHFLRSDDPRALHDHPWWNLSFLVKGSYTEVTHSLYNPLTGDPITTRGLERVVFEAGALKLRSAEYAHRVELTHGDCWTFFITGPRIRDWGFWCRKGWRNWRLFAAKDENGNSVVGAGCGEQS